MQDDFLQVRFRNGQVPDLRLRFTDGYSYEEIAASEGISRVGELVDLAVKADVIQKAGAWFSYNGERLGQGRENVKEMLLNNEDLYKEIEEKLWENVDKLSPKKKAVKAKPVAAKPAAKSEEKSSNIDVLVED